MKNIICIVCLAAYLPLAWIILFMQYGGMEGNCGKQGMENVDKWIRKNAVGADVGMDVGTDAPYRECVSGKAAKEGGVSVKILQGEGAWPGFDEEDYGEVHSISFCREWDDSRAGEKVITVVRIVRK